MLRRRRSNFLANYSGSLIVNSNILNLKSILIGSCALFKAQRAILLLARRCVSLLHLVLVTSVVAGVRGGD